MSSLKGKIALVTGASRGMGKGIALGLGEAGATVYLIGRTVTLEDRISLMGETLPGTLVETAAEVDRLGGKGIVLRCDLQNDEEVRQVFDQIMEEQGTLDLLVNTAYEWHESILDPSKGFWEIPMAALDTQLFIGFRSAYLTSHYAAQIMVPHRSGLIVNVSSPAGSGYLRSVSYSVVKAALDRLSADMAHELRAHNVAALSIWPGPVATEKTLILARKTATPLHTGNRETSFHVGRTVAALAADPEIMKKSGLVQITADLGQEYGLTEIDGSLPPSDVRDLFWPPSPPPIYRQPKPKQ